jgi:hypothetical protein
VADDVRLVLGNAEPVQGKSDGAEVTLPCCNVFRVRDGLVSEYRSHIEATPVYS